MLPVHTESLTALRDRFLRSLATLFDPVKITHGLQPRPGLGRENVFDLNGMRLIISVDLIPGPVLHVSASVDKNRFENLAKTSLSEAELLNTLAQTVENVFYSIANNNWPDDPEYRLQLLGHTPNYVIHYIAKVPESLLPQAVGVETFNKLQTDGNPTHCASQPTQQGTNSGDQAENKK